MYAFSVFRYTNLRRTLYNICKRVVAAFLNEFHEFFLQLRAEESRSRSALHLIFPAPLHFFSGPFCALRPKFRPLGNTDESTLLRNSRGSLSEDLTTVWNLLSRQRYNYVLCPAWSTDISQYRLRLGSSLLYKSVFHLNCLTAQLSYEGRAAAEGGK
jgi:hypothetical protein